jgi:ureidoglycolate lyase
MKTIIKPIKITKENFAIFGDLISGENVKPIDINAGYAKRFNDLAEINTSIDAGSPIVSIFSALKRSFPMKIDMMEKHPLGSQAFIPIKETTFLTFVAPQGDSPDISKIKSFIIPPKTGINYKPGTWHFPLISTEDTDFLVIDRKGSGENLIIHKFNEEEIILKY